MVVNTLKEWLKQQGKQTGHFERMTTKEELSIALKRYFIDIRKNTMNLNLIVLNLSYRQSSIISKKKHTDIELKKQLRQKGIGNRKKTWFGRAAFSYSTVQPPFDINFPWSLGYIRKLAFALWFRSHWGIYFTLGLFAGNILRP